MERLVGVLPVGIRALEIKREIYWTDEEVAEEVAQILKLKGAWGLSWLQEVTTEMEQDMMKLERNKNMIKRNKKEMNMMQERLEGLCNVAGVKLILMANKAEC